MSILIHSTASAEDSVAIGVMLAALGVGASVESDTDGPPGSSLTDASGPWTLIAPFSCLESIFPSDPVSGSRAPGTPPAVRTVLFHGLGSAEDAERSLRRLLHDPTARLVEVDPRPAEFHFCSGEKDVCGPLTGLTVGSDEETRCWRLVSRARPGHEVRSIVELDRAAVLLRLEVEGVDVFMLFTSRLADPRHPVVSNLDIRTCLLSLAVPMMVLKYLSRGLGWSAGNNFANVIVDDPPLATRYGHIDFRRLYELSEEHGAAATLAFIPLNYRRGGDEAVRFFRDTSDRIGICIHGCDHTRSEFGGTDRARLSALASLASKRMDSFTERTRIPHAKIMVFPQGLFSSEAMRVLKTHGYDAAVNTELRDTAGETRVTIGDMLQPAVTSYDGLPLFLRRKVSDGIANFAFDLLLDKPCLIVTHHDDFVSDALPLWGLVEALNGLPSPPEWRPLEYLVARTSLTRTSEDGTRDVKIYSPRGLLPDVTGIAGKDRLRVHKDEGQPDEIDRVLVGRTEAAWHVENGSIVVEVAGYREGDRLTVLYRQDEPVDESPPGAGYRLRAWCRRRLCEFRDDQVSKSPALREMVRAVRRVRANGD